MYVDIAISNVFNLNKHFFFSFIYLLVHDHRKIKYNLTHSNIFSLEAHFQTAICKIWYIFSPKILI